MDYCTRVHIGSVRQYCLHEGAGRAAWVGAVDCSGCSTWWHCGHAVRDFGVTSHHGGARQGPPLPVKPKLRKQGTAVVLKIGFVFQVVPRMRWSMGCPSLEYFVPPS